MTYGELSTVKTGSFEMNHIVDDVVNNVRCWGGNSWKREDVSEYDRLQILKFCLKYEVRSPFTGAKVVIA